jgi:uncharacterized protein YwgA
MNRRQVSALLVLDVLGISTAMDSFDARMSVQKGVYLAQAAGVDVGHYFSWYIRGPYASSLTQDVFDAISGDPSIVSKQYQLDKTTTAKLAELRKGFEVPASEKLEQPAWLELLASVHFLINREQSSSDPDAVTEELKKLKKSFERSQVAKAIDVLRAQKLLPS